MFQCGVRGDVARGLYHAQGRTAGYSVLCPIFVLPSKDGSARQQHEFPFRTTTGIRLHISWRPTRAVFIVRNDGDQDISPLAKETQLCFRA